MANNKLSRRCLHKYVDNRLNCQLGPPKAYFDLPSSDGPVRVVYVVYAAKARTRYAVMEWMLEKVLKPLVNGAGKGGYLYWRNKACIEVPSDPIDGWYKAYTRIAVLDNTLGPVCITNMVKPEGVAMRELEDDST